MLSENDNSIIELYVLPLNGQGYLAITNDETNLFLQSNNDSYILKISETGDFYYMIWEDFQDTYIDENENSQWDMGEILINDYNGNGFWDIDNDIWNGNGICYIESDGCLMSL